MNCRLSNVEISFNLRLFKLEIIKHRNRNFFNCRFQVLLSIFNKIETNEHEFCWSLIR